MENTDWLIDWLKFLVTTYCLRRPVRIPGYVDMCSSKAGPRYYPYSTANSSATGCPHRISQWIIGGIAINRIYGDGNERYERARTKHCTVCKFTHTHTHTHTAVFTTEHWLLNTRRSVWLFSQHCGDFDTRNTARRTTCTWAPASVCCAKQMLFFLPASVRASVCLSVKNKLKSTEQKMMMTCYEYVLRSIIAVIRLYLTSTIDLENYFSISARSDTICARYRLTAIATQQTLWMWVQISQLGGVGYCSGLGLKTIFHLLGRPIQFILM